jgi:hypothetical protein
VKILDFGEDWLPDREIWIGEAEHVYWDCSVLLITSDDDRMTGMAQIVVHCLAVM